MSRFGTTEKQARSAIATLEAAGLRAWIAGPTAGHHYLCVVCPVVFSDRPTHSGRIAVPNVSAFLALRAAALASAA